MPRFAKLPVERRRTPREPTHQAVRLTFDDGSPWIRGTMTNISTGGACVWISSSRTLPGEFNLLLPLNQRRRCRLVWRSDDKLGVEFLKP